MTCRLERHNKRGEFGSAEAKAMLGLRRGTVGALNELMQNPNWAKLLCDSQERPADQRADPCRAARRLCRSYRRIPWDVAREMG